MCVCAYVYGCRCEMGDPPSAAIHPPPYEKKRRARAFAYIPADTVVGGGRRRRATTAPNSATSVHERTTTTTTFIGRLLLSTPLTRRSAGRSVGARGRRRARHGCRRRTAADFGFRCVGFSLARSRRVQLRARPDGGFCLHLLISIEPRRRTREPPVSGGDTDCETQPPSDCDRSVLDHPSGIPAPAASVLEKMEELNK